VKRTEKVITSERGELSLSNAAPARAENSAPASPLDGEDAPARRSLSTHVVWTVAARFLILGGSLGAGIIVARVLGTEGVGALAVINVTVAVALQFGCGGFPSANTYFISRERRQLAPVWANALIFGLAAGSALALVVASLALARPSLFGDVPLQLILIAALSIPFQLVSFLGLNIFLGIERIAQFNLLDALSQAFVLVNAVVALLLLSKGLGTLVILNTAASIFMCAVVVLTIARIIRRQRDGRPFSPDAGLFRRMARYGVKFHVAVVAPLLIVRADLLIVNHYRSASEAGVYAVASQVASVLLLMPGAVATLVFPRITSAQDSKGIYTMRITRHMALLMFIVCLVTAPLGFILPFVYGQAFTDVPWQLLILLPGIFLMGLEAVLVQHFNSLGVPKAIPAFWLITLAVNVLLNILFVPSYGARAAALISTLSYALIFTLVAAYFRLETGNSPARTFLLTREEMRRLLIMKRPGVSSN
jgi:O-antigen/teichoic acid export membrane protein